MSEPQPPSPVGDGPVPKPAVVTPRAHRLRCKASLPIEQLMLPVVRSASRGMIMLIGPHGGGKTTALRHLRAVLEPNPPVELFDQSQAVAARQAADSRLVVLAADQLPPDDKSVAVFALSPWTLDDCLEYVAATHREACPSVHSRLTKDDSVSYLDGSPQLLALVIDAMAGDPSLLSAREILRRFVDQIFPKGLTRDRLILDGPFHAPLTQEVRTWWWFERIQHICIAEWIVEQLCEGLVPKQLESIEENGKLIREIAAAVRHNPVAMASLQDFLAVVGRSPAAPMVASILVAADVDWRPPEKLDLDLTGAQLMGAKWAGVNLKGAVLVGANLTGADLAGADLSGVKADGADLSFARLQGARLQSTRLVGANLLSADLSGAWASGVNLSGANLEGANLSNGVFKIAKLINTNMNGAQCKAADFSGALVHSVSLMGADFEESVLAETHLDRINLTEATWTGASFSKANFHHCNLEGLELPYANFEEANLRGCLLTGSRMPGASFRGANLMFAGLADIEWENADLRDVNFSGASFHLGSTRSGLVGSTIPCEGSRTGFYTDEFNEQTYKSPEEIRKACLCGANLLGAKVNRTDFYLVDLRRARYTRSQERHFSKSGAILHTYQK